MSLGLLSGAVQRDAHIPLEVKQMSVRFGLTRDRFEDAIRSGNTLSRALKGHIARNKFYDTGEIIDSLSSKCMATPPSQRNYVMAMGCLRRFSQLAFFKKKVDRLMGLSLLRVAEFEQLPPSAVVCQQGGPSDSFYIILTGAVNVFVKGVPTPVACLPAGLSFGELGIIRNSPRAATCKIAGQASLLMCVSKSNYLKLLKVAQAKETNEKMQFFERVPLLRQCKKSALETMCYIVSKMKFPSHTVILREGQQVPNIYFVHTGSCIILRRISGGNSSKDLMKSVHIPSSTRGNHLPVATLMSGKIVNLENISKDTPSSKVQVIAGPNGAELLSVNKSDLERLIDQSGSREELRKALIHSSQHLTKLISLSDSTVESNILKQSRQFQDDAIVSLSDSIDNIHVKLSKEGKKHAMLQHQRTLKGFEVDEIPMNKTVSKINEQKMSPLLSPRVPESEQPLSARSRSKAGLKSEKLLGDRLKSTGGAAKLIEEKTKHLGTAADLFQTSMADRHEQKLPNLETCVRRSTVSVLEQPQRRSNGAAVDMPVHSPRRPRFSDSVSKDTLRGSPRASVSCTMLTKQPVPKLEIAKLTSSPQDTSQYSPKFVLENQGPFSSVSGTPLLKPPPKETAFSHGSVSPREHAADRKDHPMSATSQPLTDSPRTSRRASILMQLNTADEGLLCDRLKMNGQLNHETLVKSKKFSTTNRSSIILPPVMMHTATPPQAPRPSNAKPQNPRNFEALISARFNYVVDNSDSDSEGSHGSL